MNAIKFLRNEHNKVRSIFSEISQASHQKETKMKLFDDLCRMLIIHENMEQTVWYPFLKKQDNLKDIIGHLIEEEKEAEKEIKKVLQLKNFEQWEEKFMEIKESVEHHANEEESKLFPRVEKILDNSTLEDLGREMREFKNEFKGEYKKAA